MLKRMKAFDLNVLERCNFPFGSKKLKGETFTTEELLNQSSRFVCSLKESLEEMISVVFPRMPPEERVRYAHLYFQTPGEDFHRRAVFLRDSDGKVVATALFDYGWVNYSNAKYSSIYSILRSVTPEYQGCGIGQAMSAGILNDIQPDVLFANTYQSDSLHAWGDLVKKRRVTSYNVYPALEMIDGEEILVTVPFSDLEFVVRAFEQIYAQMVSHPSVVQRELRNMTLFMVRKDNHGAVFDFDPWFKDGRKDKLADALGATDRDGVMLVFLRKDRC